MDREAAMKKPSPKHVIALLLILLSHAALAAEKGVKLHQLFMDVGKKVRAAGHGMDAVAFFAAAAQLMEPTLGEHSDVAYAYTEIGNTLRMEKRYGAAEEMIRRALDIFSADLPPGDINTIRCLNDLGLVYMDTGRLQEAHDAFDKVIATLGNPTTNALLGVLAFTYNNRGAVSIFEDNLNAAHDDFIAALAASAKAKAGGWDVSDTEKGALLNLAYLLLEQDHIEEAAQTVAKARRLIQRNGVQGDWNLKDVLNREAQISDRRGDWDAAISALQQEIEILNRAGAGGRSMAYPHNFLADVFRKAGRVDEAVHSSDMATRELEVDLATEGRRVNVGALAGYGKPQSARGIYETQVAVLFAAAEKEKPNSESELNYLVRAFEAAQNAHESGATKAINDLGARLAAGTDNLASLLRRRQDLVIELRERQVEVTKYVDQNSKGSLARGKAHVTRLRDVRNPRSSAKPTNSLVTERSLASLEQKLEETRLALERIDTQLRNEFPKFASYSRPAPIPEKDLAKLLLPREALLTTLVTDQGTYLWLSTPDTSVMRVDYDSTTIDLSRRVADLRRSIDASPEGLRRLLSKPYALDDAKLLYDRLLGKFADVLRETDHLIVVADGPLLSLPFAALVTEAAPSIREFGDYRRVAWLARSYGISIVPSVAAFSILRRPTVTTLAPEPFLGIGAPSLPSGAGPANSVAAQLARLAPLPESKFELESVARSLGAPADSVLTGAAATRASLLQHDLTKYRVLFFATHGLTRGELAGLTEPALVLSSDGGDLGLLLASEIAALHLNSDLTVLSACSTAAGDGSPGGEGLSGLARAFLYAGAKSLLVSHWPIESSVAASITTRTLEGYTTDPRKGRDGALRSAMIAIIDDSSHPEHAHPAYWAPFVLIGLPDASQSNAQHGGEGP
jgi:CHAT domain-containing protein/tetratricopeptide (TPR) repeat protein